MKPNLQIAILAKQIQEYAMAYCYCIMGMGLLGSLLLNPFGKCYNIPVSIITILIFIFATIKMKKNENKISHSLVELSIKLNKDVSVGEAVA